MRRRLFQVACNGVEERQTPAAMAATLATYVSPVIGSMPVDAVDTGAVMQIIEAPWQSRPVTASRVRGRIESVLSWASARGLRTGQNPALWRGHLDQLLPARNKVQPVEHHVAVNYDEIPALMARLLDIDTTAAKALAFTVLTVARTGEVIGATWAEIDLDAKVWTIPGDRMKARREHRVPLSEPALAILIAMPGCTGFLFPWAVAPRMSADIMRNVLRDMGFAAATVHGMRSAFRDWCGNETDFAREICEGALAHAIGGAVEQAYRRSDALGKRRALMAAWAAFVIGKNALVTTGEPRARVTAPSLA